MLFKNVDDKFKDIGFIKTEEVSWRTTYKRRKPGYMDVIILSIDKNGKEGISVYRNYSDCSCVITSLSIYESLLCIEKLRTFHYRNTMSVCNNILLMLLNKKLKGDTYND